MAILTFLALLLGISAAAWVLSWGAEQLAERYGANFVGSIVLALITTLPEYMFVLFACLKAREDPKMYQVALGSAIGACTMLTTLGYGLVIFFATSRLSKHPVKSIHLTHATGVDALYLAMTAVVALTLAWVGGGFSVIDGAILLVFFLFYLVNHWRRARRHMFGIADHTERTPVSPWAWVAMAGAGAVIVLLAEPFVNSMISVATALNISPVIIALALGPVASEMPEKLTAYVTVLRDGKLAEISVCNFIGSAINHNTLLMAMIPIIAFARSPHEGLVPNMVSPAFIMVAPLAVIAAASLWRRHLQPWQGYVFVALYIGVLIAWFHGFGPAH